MGWRSRTVWARVKRDTGVAGSDQRVGEYLSEWMEERQYSPVIELARLPDVVSALVAKAAVELWKPAQDEAAAILERERICMREAIEAQGNEIARFTSELERMGEHVVTVRARAFWRSFAQEIWEVLPESEAMHLNVIAGRIGHEFIKDAEGRPGESGPKLLRGVIDQRIKFKKPIASEGGGRYRRRRTTDAAA